MGSLVLRVNDAQHLSEADDLLHDLSFDLSRISYDAQEAVFELVLYRSQKTRDLFSSRRHRGIGNGSFLLKILNVASYVVNDPQGLVEHSYSRLRWTKPRSLSLTSNFPGSIDLDVSLLALEIEEQPNP